MGSGGYPPVTVGVPSPTIPRRPEGAPQPLSFAQERLLMLERLTPGVTAYNVPRVLRVAGRLDAELLRRAFEIVVARHEPLRTTIEFVDGAPVQRVMSAPPFELPVVELHGRADAEADANAIVEELAWRPFDLTSDLMIRATLLRLGEGEDRLAIVCHHLTSDFASASILVQELAEAYDALAAGREPALPELPITYGDYASWQRERLDGPAMRRSLDAWCERLAGAPDRTELPADHARPAAKTYRGGSRLRALDADLGTGVRTLARSNSVSPFVVLLAALDTLVYRYTGTADVVVGTVATGRHHEETLPLIGFFTNTLVLRTDLAGEPSFTELLARIKQTVFGALAHQELPFERLVEELNPRRDLSHSPLFQVLFAYDVDVAAPEIGGFLVRVESVEARWSRFDLAVEARERTDGGIDLEAEYSTDLFEPETVNRLLAHLETLLRGAIAAPDTPITALPLMTSEERLELERWNSTDRPLPQACLHELVAAVAGERPDTVAVQGGETRITYAELEEDSNRLARHLQALGVEEGALVAVVLDRVPEQLVAFLGVLKTGAAYVPADPTYPPARLETILADSDAPVLITQEHLLDRLPVGNATVVCLDRDGPAIRERDAGPLVLTTDPERLAYVIYTSGSTGRPKGVEIRHRSVVNLLQSMRERPGLGSGDVVVNVTTTAFDLSVPDLYLPLVCGARLVVLPAEQTQDGRLLAAALDDAGATFVQATATTWSLLVESGWPGRPGLKIVCGGEALPAALVEELLARGAELWHMYGPTETTVWSSSLRLTSGGAPPIGGPIENTRFYVVDERLELLPVGVPGELLIGGVGLARGYRNLPELTAERFLADPFAGDAEARVYRTGDLMRRRSDGTLEFLGRLDQQVKLHGFRIELGEIEALLDRHPEVRASVAALRADGPAGSLLVAYAVLHPGAAVTSEALRRYVATSLPGYMVPSVVVILDELPITANGKLDRTALPAPGVERETLVQAYVAPRTPLEEQLAAIWMELLPVDRVGIDDDFFDLGGHSMLALRLVARIQQSFAVELFLSAVFEHPTIRELAADVAEKMVADAGDDELAAILDELEVAGA